MVYINKGDHDNPHRLPKDDSEGSQDIVHHDYAHTNIPPKMPEEIEKLEYIYQHFQDHKKVYESDPQVTTEPVHDTLYPQMNNDIEYRLFENVIDSYYLDSQIRDDFQCTKTYYTHDTTASTIYLLGSIFKLAPFLNGASIFKQSCSIFKQPLLALFLNGAAPFSSNNYKKMDKK